MKNKHTTIHKHEGSTFYFGVFFFLLFIWLILSVWSVYEILFLGKSGGNAFIGLIIMFIIQISK